MNHKKIVVFETGGGARQNNTFNRTAVGNCRYGWPACYLYERCLERGIQLCTPDVYFVMDPKPKEALYVRHSVATEEKKIVASGAQPVALALFESPLAAPAFYFSLRRQSARYPHSFLLRGARPLVSPETVFSAATAPNSYSARDLVRGNFSARKFLTLINSNTRVKPMKKMYITVRHMLTPLPAFSNRELYIARLEAIRYFSRYDYFDLYGYGWDISPRYSGGIYDDAVRKSYRGAVDDKFQILQNYKFAICFENTIFGGYISEKMIDAMVAGCIPVYWGAPDVGEFIPENAFIDFRKFKNFTELDYALRHIDETTYHAYLDNITGFLNSNQYYYFSQEKYATDFIAVFEKYFR